MICLTPKPNQSFFVYRIQSKANFFLTEKELFKKNWEWRIEQKRKEGYFLNAFATAIKKDPSTSIRKHVNEVNIHEKIVRTAISQDLRPDLNLLDYTLWGVLENKMQFPIQILVCLRLSFKRNVIKFLKEFILKACKSFRRSVHTIMEKMVAILSKFTVLCLSSYFVVYLLNLKLIVFYNRVAYYYTRISLNFLLHPVCVCVCTHNVMVTIVGNGHGDSNLNLRWSYLHFA